MLIFYGVYYAFFVVVAILSRRRRTTVLDTIVLFDGDHNIGLVNGVVGLSCLENAGNPVVNIVITTLFW